MRKQSGRGSAPGASEKPARPAGERGIASWPNAREYGRDGIVVPKFRHGTREPWLTRGLRTRGLMIKTKCLLLLLVPLLSGCVTAEQRAQAKTRQQAALDATDARRCESFGAPLGTEAHFQCRMMLASQRATQEAQDEAVRQQQSLMMLQSGLEMMANGR
jgi:hypothetical protein